MWCSPRNAQKAMWPGFAIFLFLGMMFWWGFSPWMLFFLFFFVIPMMKGWHHWGGWGDHPGEPAEKEKRKHEDIKRKNDDNDDDSYIRSSDGQWLEIVD